MHKSIMFCALLAGFASTSSSESCFGQNSPPIQEAGSLGHFNSVNTRLNMAASAALASAESSGTTVESRPNDSERSSEHTQASPIERSSSPLNPVLRDFVRPILEREGVPEEMSAVAQIESAGNPYALSPKGARGVWQLMPETARRYGLRVDPGTDDRVSIEKSTTAAARYLRDLYDQFRSWPIALAAYNAGEHNIVRAIGRARSNDFAVLSTMGLIPPETRRYVPAVLAFAASEALVAHSSGDQRLRPDVFVFASSVLDENEKYDVRNNH